MLSDITVSACGPIPDLKLFFALFLHRFAMKTACHCVSCMLVVTSSQTYRCRGNRRYGKKIFAGNGSYVSTGAILTNTPSCRVKYASFFMHIETGRPAPVLTVSYRRHSATEKYHQSPDRRATIVWRSLSQIYCNGQIVEPKCIRGIAN